jgi:hypothetical protein
MNTTWVKFTDLMKDVAATQNLDFDLGQILAPQRRRICEALNAATAYAWRFSLWPESVERGFDVLEAYTEDPTEAWEEGTDAKVLPMREAQGRIYVQGTTDGSYDGEALFYAVRLAPPRWGADERSAATAYQPGDCIYDPATGEGWRCHRAHTNQSVSSTWDHWRSGVAYTTETRLRGGVLFGCSQGHTASADNEPAFGVEWADNWPSSSIKYWSPQRLPEYLRTAVIMGARAWMESGVAAVMQEAMEDELLHLQQQMMVLRRQGLRQGGTLARV